MARRTSALRPADPKLGRRSRRPAAHAARDKLGRDLNAALARSTDRGRPHLVVGKAETIPCPAQSTAWMEHRTRLESAIAAFSNHQRLTTPIDAARGDVIALCPKRIGDV